MSNVLTELRRLLSSGDPGVTTGTVKSFAGGIMYVSVGRSVATFPLEANVSLGDTVAISGGAVIGIIGGGVNFGECHPQ